MTGLGTHHFGQDMDLAPILGVLWHRPVDQKEPTNSLRKIN